MSKIENEKQIKCLNCDSIIVIKRGKCKNCGLTLKEMAPDEPPSVDYYDPKSKEFLTWPLAIFFGGIMFWVLPIIYMSDALNNALDSSNNVPGVYLSIGIIFAFLYLGSYIAHRVKVSKHNKYLLMRRYYDEFCDKEKYNAKLKAAEELRKEQERQSQIDREIREKRKRDFNASLVLKYGPEISRYNRFRLFNNYLLICSDEKVLQEYDLSAFVGCELSYSKSSGKAVLLLNDPSSQSKFDEIINGKNGKYFYLSDYKPSDADKTEINKFFIKLKDQFNK